MQSISEYGKKTEIYGNETLFREMGYYILRLEQYVKSLKIFDEAIKYTPDDVRALIARARSLAKESLYEGAIKDINKALDIEPGNLVALAEKALQTYLKGEFEDGLVQNIRMLPIRQKPEHFALGVMYCYNAVNTCVGDPAGRPLRDYFKIIRQLAWEKNQSVLDNTTGHKKHKRKIKRFFIEQTPDNFHSMVPQKRKDVMTKKTVDKEHSIRDSLHSHQFEKQFVIPLHDDFPFQPLQRYTSNIENFMAEKYLGRMSLDKNFLKNFENEPGASCPNQQGTEKVKKLAKTGYKMVAYKQEVLRTRRPFYHIRYKEGTSTVTLKLRKAQEIYMQQQTTKHEAEMLMNRLRKYSQERKFKAMLTQAEKVREFCDAKPKRLLPNKDVYLEEIFTIIRKGYYQLHRLNLDQYPWDQVKRIQVAFGLPVSREPSTDSVIESLKTPITDHKKELIILEKRLKKQAQSTDEICWCYYQMCNRNIELKQHDVAKLHAKHCIQISRKEKNLEWLFVATMLLVKLNVQIHNKNDAYVELNNAMAVAEKLQNENLKQYLKRCFEVIQNIDLDVFQSAELLKQRQKKILALMDKTLKNEFSHLFRQMAALPDTRRMSILPGHGATDATGKGRSRQKSRASIKLTINKPPSENEIQINSSVKKRDTKGVEFMKLIPILDTDEDKNY